MPDNCVIKEFTLVEMTDIAEKAHKLSQICENAFYKVHYTRLASEAYILLDGYKCRLNKARNENQ